MPYTQEWYKKNREQKLKTNHKYLHSIKGKYAQYKAAAKSRKKDFSISLSEFTQIISKPCFYCGATEKIGVDRKDDTKSYILPNCLPCCGVCNFMKHKFPYDLFISQCKKIAYNVASSSG